MSMGLVNLTKGLAKAPSSEEAEAPTLWSPDAKCQLIGKDPAAGKD